MAENGAAIEGATPATDDRRRLLIVGLVALAVVIRVGVDLPQWAEAGGGTLAEPLGPTSVVALAVGTLLWLLPIGVVLAGLLRARPWGPVAAVALGLFMVFPVGISFVWLSTPFELAQAGMVASDVLLLAAAGVAATLVPWIRAGSPTPARLLLWVGGIAVVAGLHVPISAGGRGLESLASSLLRFGGTPVEWTVVAVSVVALVGIVVIADRLPTRLAVGAVAVLAATGVGPLSAILQTWGVGESLLPIAWLGPLGSVALVMWLREAGRTTDPVTVEDHDAAVSAG